MSAKIYQRILQIGIIASLATILLLFTGLLFPYITSKQLPFNILMEILLPIWLVFIWRYKRYRPRKNLISFGLLAYFFVILISCFFGVDFNLSFWGDAERMLGFFHLLHFLIFYLILITVFKKRREWNILLAVSIIVATTISLIGLFGKNPYSLIGNTAYVSAYLIFNLYFSTLLFFREKSYLRYLYFIPIVLMLFEFKNMHTSGAIIGLGISILLGLFLYGLLHINRRIKKVSLWIFSLAIIAIIILFAQSNSTWFKNSFLKNLTAQKFTFQTRLISWRGAINDFKYHPMLGTGFGNYAIIFDRQFDPQFFDYARTDTYFDRAHNNLIDVLSTTGLLGLLSYLSIFIAVIYYLWQILKRNNFFIDNNEKGRNNLEILILFLLLIAYFIQNLAVFDSFVTYTGLMITLSYIYFLINNRESGEDMIELAENNETSENEEKIVELNNKKYVTEISILIILLLIAFLSINYFTLRPWKVFTNSIKAYGQILSGDTIDGIIAYQKSLIGTPLDRDARSTLINLLMTSPEYFSSLKTLEKAEALSYVIALTEKNLAYNPQDSLTQLQLAQVLDNAARLSYRNQEKFQEYSEGSLIAIDKAIEASPKRIPLYITKAQILLTQSQAEKGIESLKYAISLNKKYPDAYCRLAQFYLILEREDEIGESLNQCLALNGIDQINSSPILMAAANLYIIEQDYTRALIVVEHLAELYSDNAEIWFNLAKLYLVVGDENGAQVAIDKAIKLDPSLYDEFQKLKEAVKNQ